MDSEMKKWLLRRQPYCKLCVGPRMAREVMKSGNDYISLCSWHATEMRELKAKGFDELDV